MTRLKAVFFVAAMLAGLGAVDVMSSESFDPYTAPPLLALGSGEAPSGAHCSAGIAPAV